MTIRVNNIDTLIMQVHRHGVSRVDLSLAVELLGYLIGNRTVKDGEEFTLEFESEHYHPCNLVETTENDKVLLAKRGNRNTLTPIVLGRSPQLTNSVFFVFRYENKGDCPLMRVITSFYGKKTYKEIAQYQTQDEFIEAYRFWEHHALIPEDDLPFQISDEYESFHAYAQALSVEKFQMDIVE